MDDETRLTFGGPLQLATLDDERFEMRDVELRIRPDEARLKFRVDATGYARMIERSLFNLLPLVRGAGELESGDIEITAHLRPELLADLRAADLEPEVIVAGLARTERTGLLGALAATESWLATAIAAKLATPPGLTGELAMGFPTAWSRESLDADPIPPLREMVEAFFASQDWDVDQIGESLLCANVAGETGAWRFLARIDEAQRRCAISSVHPDEVPAPRRAEVAAVLAAKNRDLDAGAFDIDMLDGEVRLRSTLFAGDEGLPASLFARSVHANLEAFDACFAELATLVRG